MGRRERSSVDTKGFNIAVPPQFYTRVGFSLFARLDLSTAPKMRLLLLWNVNSDPPILGMKKKRHYSLDLLSSQGSPPRQLPGAQIKHAYGNLMEKEARNAPARSYPCLALYSWADFKYSGQSRLFFLVEEARPENDSRGGGGAAVWDSFEKSDGGEA